ncbi:MAG: hypothetical protein SVV03_02965 [Candidatus Nanohaloarchaea archaeon]|nr:hypothetical protein [Candidatus Nanohaloarchaea archaeon]
MRSRLIVISLAVSILLAGCIGGQEGQQQKDSQSKSQRGIIIEDLSISNTDLEPGEQSRITVTFQNTNSEDVEDLLARMVNTGQLEVSGEVECRQERMRASEGPSQGQRKRCTWTLECADRCTDISRKSTEKFTVEPSVVWTYSNRVTESENSISIEFQSPADFRSDEVEKNSYTAENGDISLSSEYSTPQSTGSASIVLSQTLTNKGNGRLVSPVDLEYRGSLVSEEAVDLSSFANCRKLAVPEGEASQEAECGLKLLNPEPETVYKLRIAGRYKYRKSKKVNLEIVPTQVQ